MKVKEIWKEHKNLIIGGVLITAGVVGIIVVSKLCKTKVTIGTAHKIFEDREEAIDVFKKFTEIAKDAALFYENGKYAVIDL